MDVKRTGFFSLSIDSEADIGVCRRKAVVLSGEIGFDKTKAAEIAILVTEMVSNVVKHGKNKGKLVACQILDDLGDKAIEIWCFDAGDGFANFNESLRDGNSTVNTLGVGLGSIRRFSDELEFNPEITKNKEEIYASDDLLFKNCIRSRKWIPKNKVIRRHYQLEIGLATRPKPGEQLNGDAIVVVHVDANTTVAAVIDGLGHGKEAHFASHLAKEQILLKAELPLSTLMQHIHGSIKGTRGCVIGLLKINTKINKLYFSGIGNIECFLVHDGQKKSLLSFGGIMGHNMRTPRIFETDFILEDMVCMYSDGIFSRWRIEDLDEECDNQEKTNVVLNKFSRSNDDASILIISHKV